MENFDVEKWIKDAVRTPTGAALISAVAVLTAVAGVFATVVLVQWLVALLPLAPLGLVAWWWVRDSADRADRFGKELGEKEKEDAASHVADLLKSAAHVKHVRISWDAIEPGEHAPPPEEIKGDE